MNDKPRHQRILDRMDALVEKAISNFVITGKGRLICQGSGKNHLISGSPASRTNTIPSTASVPDTNRALIKKGSEFQVNLGTVDSVSLTLSGTSIYGDGTPGSVPLLPNNDADVYAKVVVTPTSIYYDGSAYGIGNMLVSTAEIVTTGINLFPTEVLAIFSPSTGSATAGTYYYWISRIIDEDATYPSPAPFPRVFSGFLGIFKLDGLSVGMFNPGFPGTDPEVDYI